MKKLIFLMIIGLTFSACGSGTSNNTSKTSMAEKDPKVNGQVVSYSTENTTLNGYIAYDENSSETRPGVLIVHEWWGHNEYVRERADSLAKLGYVAIAVDMYGEGKQAMHPEDAQKFSGEVFSNLYEAKARFEAAMATLKENEYVNADQIAAIGYCFGGSVVLSMANAGYDLEAVAAFHAGVELPVQPSKDIKAKILVANGGDDPFVTPESVATYKSAMDSIGADYKYVAYDGTVHAFTSPAADSLGAKFDLPLAYNPEADKASWNELMMLFEKVFGE